VLGFGPQFGYIFPVGDKLQGYLNLKACGEFANQNRADGWNLWLTFHFAGVAAGDARKAHDHEIGSRL
jgi:hypothetical protein